MKNEIERKFFVRERPDLSGIVPLSYERYFVERGNGKETRISRVGNSYIYEEKQEISFLERTREKREISKEEFERLRQGASDVIIRDRYEISRNPDIVIQVYHGRFEGLVRAEVEFDSEESAKSFTPPAWMGAEMTGLSIARDASLLDLEDEEFKKYLQRPDGR